jgi:nucleoside-diphosphate-sugar epimerase
MALPPSNGKTVLVTGINGYIGSTIGLLVLSKGYTLRGTTRRLNNVKSLLEGPFKPYADRLEIFEVLDMTAANAYKDAVAGK